MRVTSVYCDARSQHQSNGLKWGENEVCLTMQFVQSPVYISACSVCKQSKGQLGSSCGQGASVCSWDSPEPPQQWESNFSPSGIRCLACARRIFLLLMGAFCAVDNRKRKEIKCENVGGTASRESLVRTLLWISLPINKGKPCAYVSHAVAVEPMSFAPLPSKADAHPPGVHEWCAALGSVPAASPSLQTSLKSSKTTKHIKWRI